MWWERDPELLAQEVRALEVAGFRVHHRDLDSTRAGLQLYVERDAAQFTVRYPCGFPGVSTLAWRGWSGAAPAARVSSPDRVHSGIGVVALTDLMYRRPTQMDFGITEFGVLLAGPWPSSIDDHDGGPLGASMSGRGSTVLLTDIGGAPRVNQVLWGSMSVAPAFEQLIKGWWARGEAPDWERGPDAVAAAIERAVVRWHRLGSEALRGDPAPILGVTWPYDGGQFAVRWQFMRRVDGRPTFGANAQAFPESFRIRAPYATQLERHRVAIVGCGSLGWPISVGLARAGVRRFALFDRDRLVPGNLARLGAQLGQVGEYKVDALRAALYQVAAGMDVSVHTDFVGLEVESRALAAVEPTLIIDVAADEATPNQVNAAALTLGVPALYAWMTRGVRNARIFRVVPGRTPCYACVAWARPRSLVLERHSQALEFTWIGANFNIDPIAAAAVRMAVRTLCGDPVDATNPDHLVLRVGGPVPVAERLHFTRNPRCRWCGQ